MDLKAVSWEAMDLIYLALGQEQVSGSWDDSNEPLGMIKRWNFLVAKNYWFLENYSVSWS